MSYSIIFDMLGKNGSVLGCYCCFLFWEWLLSCECTRVAIYSSSPNLGGGGEVCYQVWFLAYLAYYMLYMPIMGILRIYSIQYQCLTCSCFSLVLQFVGCITYNDIASQAMKEPPLQHWTSAAHNGMKNPVQWVLCWFSHLACST